MRRSTNGLPLVPSVLRLFRKLRRPWQAGEGNQECLDFLALHANDSGENGLQNGPAPNQPVCPGPVFLAALFVQQNLLAVLILANFLFDFPFLLGLVNSCYSSFSSQPFLAKIFCNFLSAPVTLSQAQLPLIPSSAAISRNFFFKAYRA